MTAGFQEGRQSCVTRLLDIRYYVVSARGATARLESGPALFMLVVFGLIALCLLPIWMTFDLASTWEFTTGARDASAPALYSLGDRATGILGVSVASALVGAIFTSFTLLPSLFELAFPTVQHPLLNMILLSSVTFDYITDWGKAWEVAGGWTTNPALHFIYAAAFCGFVSVVVQALLALCVTIIIYAAIAIVRGPVRDVQTIVMGQ